MIRGEYGWDVWGGELSDPSAVFFLQRCLGGVVVAKRAPRRGGWTGDTAVNQLSGQTLHDNSQWPKSLSLIRRVHHPLANGDSHIPSAGQRMRWETLGLMWCCDFSHHRQSVRDRKSVV